MTAGEEAPESAGRRNLRSLSLASFLTDLSSEMVLNLVPLFLWSVVGVGAHVIGLVEGVAASTASLLKLASGWLSDRLGARKGLTLAGYALSAAAKPFFYLAGAWSQVAAVRWVERAGKGLRTAPRDALIADSLVSARRGFAFGVHRAADTAGAVGGLAIAWLVVTWLQGRGGALLEGTFRTLVLLSLVPAVLAVAVVWLGVREVRPKAPAGERPRPGWRQLGRPFLVYLAIVAVFDLGNSSDAFLVLRAAERGVGAAEVVAMLLLFNLVYAASSTPGGLLSDRLGRRRVLVAGWLLYAGVYLGFAAVEEGRQLWGLYALYGLYYGLTHGTARAMVADLVPAESRGTAFGAYHATLGVLDLPASLIAGVLWQGVAGWRGFGPPAPFLFGAATAALAALGLALWGERAKRS